MKAKLKIVGVLSLFFALCIILSSCSSGSSSAPVVNQDASGLYTGSGSGKFNAGAQKTMTQVKGMVQGGTFIFFDVATNILYEGTLTTKQSDVTGTAVVYEAGVMVNAAVAVTGTVTNGSKIQLTLAAKGKFKGGSIDATYDSQYKRAADNARITTSGAGKKPWTGTVVMKILTMDMSFRVFADNQYTAISSNADVSKRCSHETANVVLNSTVNVYTLQEDIVLVAGDASTACEIVATGYKGFAAVVDGSNFSNNTLWYAVTNGSFSVFAILTR